MADPVTIAMAAAGAMKTVSGLVSGMSGASAADAQARQDEGMARSASAQADGREEQLRRQARQQLGEQVAGVAQSGIGFTQSTKNLTDQMGAESSYDALNARYDGTLKRTSLLNDAAEQRAKAKVGRITTALGAGSDALSTFADYAKGGGKLPFGWGKKPDPMNVEQNRI